jgi:beta-galactosidase
VGTETYPMRAFEYWSQVEALPYVIGDFVWTALDYLGEAGIGRIKEADDPLFCGKYPWSHAFCGDIDLCGFKRPQSYYRDCVWGFFGKPFIAVHNPAFYGQEREITPWGWPEVYDSWHWPAWEGKPVKAEIYCGAEEVELFVNSVSQGRKKAGKANRYLAAYDLVYTPGELLCVAYRAGKEIARAALVTPGAPYQIRLTADRAKLEGFGDLCYVTAQVLDKAGNLADRADNRMYVTAWGQGQLLALGSQNPKPDEPYVGNTRKCCRGKVLAILRGNGAAGQLIVTAAAEGLQTGTLTLEVTKGPQGAESI